MPAAPATVGVDTYAPVTLRCRLAAIARVHREARHRFDSRDPTIRNALRSVTHAQDQAAALTTAEIRRLVRSYDLDFTGRRDRALRLLGYAGALRRSELVGADIERLKFDAPMPEVAEHFAKLLQ